MTTAIIESLDQEGRGVAHTNGKTIFIEGALPGETVEYTSFRKKPSYEFANLAQVIRESSQRVSPKCPHFAMCGGCSMQHLEERAQVAMKQRILEDNLAHIGKVKAEEIIAPVYGMHWQYRHRARFSVRFVEKKEKLLVGFREKKSHFVADIKGCEVIPARISSMLVPLAAMIESLGIKRHVPQVELAIGENVDALNFRILQGLSPQDESILREFADKNGIVVYLQPKGPDSVHVFHPKNAAGLSYSLPEFSLTMPFSPSDFTQVNPAVNRILVGKALRLLQAKKGEKVLDLFCGLGNFSLAIARSGAEVLGIEGSRELVSRAQENAVANGIDNAAFLEMDLFKMTPERWTALGKFDKLLIDPPRTGAMEVVQSLGPDSPRRIVYVSCNPATLARDAGILVREKNYALKAAGVINMFAHTSHVESIALFERQDTPVNC